MLAHLEVVLTAFVAAAKRDRMRALAAKPSRRGDLHAALLHDTRAFAPGVLHRFAGPAVPDRPAVLAALGARPASLGYAVSTIAELDDRELPVGDALTAALGRERDTLILCLATRRAFLETHEGERYWLA